MMQSKKRSNLRDVASRAGVSVATVSRVLNTPDLVAQDTRRRVETAIEELNFVPSPSARAINSGRTHIVGALVPTLDHAIFARYLNALEEELALCGLSLIVATTNGDSAQEAKRAEDLMNLGVEGLIVSGLRRSPAFTAHVRRRTLPVIATSYFAPDHDLPTIGYDNAGIAAMAWDHLFDLGHRHIAVFHGPLATNDRTLARVNAIRERATPQTVFIENALFYETAAQSVQDLVARNSAVTALLCASDVLAQGALFGLQALGRAVPETMSIVGMDDLPASRTTSPALTTIRLPLDDMGRHTARAMHDWIETGARPAPRRLASEMILRGSTRQV